MAWISKFKLGRAAYESEFEVNPSAMTFTPTKIEDMGRGLDGSGIDLTLSNNRPRFQINGNYVTPAQANQFLSLLHIDYEPLVFEPVDYSGDQVYEVWQERVIAKTATELTIPENSFTRAGRLRQYNGSAAVIRAVGLWANMGLTHGRIGQGANLITPGLWGKILVEPFNLLPTGLLSAAGKNWLITGGNGTTRDFYVDTAAPLEGTKDLIATTDGTGAAISAARANGGLWSPTSPFAQDGFDAEFHTAEWEMQLIDNTTGTEVAVEAQGEGVLSAWKLVVKVTGATTGTYEWWHNGSLVAGPAALSSPFAAHTYEVLVTATTVEFRVDSTPVYGPTGPATNVFNTVALSCAPAVGAPSGTVAHWDAFDINDGDGYDPSRKTFDIVVSPGLTPGAPYWLTYAYNAIAVMLSTVPLQVNGGMVDIVKYNFSLEGM